MEVDSVIFYTNNLNEIVDFYENQIGFKLGYRHGDKFASFVFENSTKLGIKQRVEEREIPGSQTIIVTPSDIQSTYDEIREKGLEIYKPLTKEDWGTEFSLLDPDGNKLEFIVRK